MLFFYRFKWQNKVYRYVIVLKNKSFLCNHRFLLFLMALRNAISFILLYPYFLYARGVPLILDYTISQYNLRGKRERMSVFDYYSRKEGFCIGPMLKIKFDFFAKQSLSSFGYSSYLYVRSIYNLKKKHFWISLYDTMIFFILTS